MEKNDGHLRGEEEQLPGRACAHQNSDLQEDEADGRQRVAPNAIMSVMVKAVQELSTQVDELKAEIQTLKGE